MWPNKNIPEKRRRKTLLPTRTTSPLPISCSVIYLSLWSASFILLASTSDPYGTLNNGYDNLGTAYEFKIHVDAGKEDCFYQYIEAGSSLYIAFQVMRGGDGQAGFYVNGPTGQPLLPYQWKQHAELDDANVIQSGYYSLCIDNKPASFQSKLVSLYLASLKRDEWEKYIQELSAADVTTNNATSHLRNVQLNINEMMKYLEHSKQQHSYDGYLAESNNRYVQNWSLLQCIVVVACSLVQVYFVRKLFDANDYGKAGAFRARA